MTKERRPLIRIKNLKKYFPIVRDTGFFTREHLDLKANDGISIDIFEGETLGLVGESGCGKSTFGRTLLQIYEQTAGRTVYYGQDIYEFSPKYAVGMLDKLAENRDKVFAMKKDVEIALEEYTKLDQEDENKQTKFLEYEDLRQEHENLMFDITSIAGGLVLSDDLNEIADLMKEEYNLKVAEAKGENGNKTRINEIEKKLEEYRNKLKDKDEFEEYEKERDMGIDLTRLEEEEMRVLRDDMQLIFQDPYSSLNPRLTVGQIISEGMYTHGIMNKKDPDRQERIIDIMDKCGLAPYFIHRYPHQFSGGQRQRIGIARSVALEPKFIVCDEAVSALDVSIQSQIINLLLDLKEQENLTYLFISHDLSVIKYISDRVGVMYLGNIVEIAETADLYAYPRHPYTEALLSAIPTTDREDVDKEHIIIEGDIPSPINPPKGCKFNTRCPYVTEVCMEIVPELEEVEPGHFVACHHKLEKKEN